LNIPDKKVLIQKAGDPKVLPFVARKVLKTMSRESSSSSELCDIMEKDQTIAARVLKISNSAFYGLRQEVSSLKQAIMILGFSTIKSLVLSASTKSIYKKFGITEQLLWDHSVGVAISARLISARFGSEMEDIAFLGGLMHDLGKVVMNNETPAVFAEVMMKVYNDDIDSITAEEEVYGYNHTEVGSGVISKWGFAPVLIKILEKHHLNKCSLNEIKDLKVANGVACVNLADNICRFLGIGFKEPNDEIVLHEFPSAVFLEMSEEKLNGLVKDIDETYKIEKSVFQ
jgi:putative nucleotidyltransferase with HDIG domain